jgi:hypothetical protein
MDGVSVIFLSGAINRVTEQLKRAFLDKSSLDDDRKGAIVLFISLVLGVAGVVLLFPSTNLVAGLGASPFAEQVVTGIVIGGLANGIDFLAKKLDQPTVQGKATIVSSTPVTATSEVTIS